MSRRYANGVALPARTPLELLAYKREWARAHREKQAKISHAWHHANRERRNAHRHLARLRAMEDPRHSHVRKMAALAAMYPKRRMHYETAR